ncbi:hypothetical protein F5B20DRAFT_533519 [Whalleya microplaca]|nr:hypothetical protein F5B20DRAFT_533519 [Whalleya microplaca]
MPDFFSSILCVFVCLYFCLCSKRHSFNCRSSGKPSVPFNLYRRRLVVYVSHQNFYLSGKLFLITIPKQVSWQTF